MSDELVRLIATAAVSVVSFTIGCVTSIALGTSFSSYIWIFSGGCAAGFVTLYPLALLLLPKKIEKSGDYGSAHWATEKEIAQSQLRGSNGIIVGATKRKKKVRFLRYDGEGHVFVVSPTRSGKGVSIIIPTALTWEHSVLFNDIKGELWALTSGWRKKQFNSLCLRFDATCDDGSAARWNPLFEIRPYPQDVRDAQNIALTITSGESSTHSENERHWRIMGTRLLKAAILHQLYVGTDKSLAGCYKLLTSLGRDLEDTLLMMLRTPHDTSLRYGWIDEETKRPTPVHPVIAHIARDMLSKSDRERSSIVSSTISYVEPFDDPIMASNISVSDFSLSDLINNEQPVSLYLTTPVADLERVKTLHRLLFTLAGERNTEHLDFADGLPAPKYKHRLLEVFDECAHLGYMPVIQKQFSLASGFGIQGMFIFQDFSQLFDLYGRNESITSNCDVKVTFAPNNLETAEYISRLLGNETREKNSSGAIFSKKQTKHKHSFARALLTPDECSRLPKEKSIILRNGYPPMLGDKVPYYLISELVDRTKIPPPPSDRIPFKVPRWFENISEHVPLKERILKQTNPKITSEIPPKKKRGRKPKIIKEQGELFSE